MTEVVIENEVEENEIEQVEGEQNEDASQEDEVVVTIGDEDPEVEESATAPEWVRNLRKSDREKARRIKELEEALNRTTAPPEQSIQLGAKPSLDSCDYDSEVYERELEKWYETKRKADEHAAQAAREKETATEAWNTKLKSYDAAKTTLKVADFDESEEVVKDKLSVIQQGIILQGADNPALVVYALGKNPTKAKELAEEKDPVKFAFAIAKMETQLKIKNRKAPPPPEKTVTGKSGGSGAVDSTLERLRAEADRTGDLTKVLEYKRNKKLS